MSQMQKLKEEITALRKQLRKENRERKQAQATLDEMAIRDSLTGLFSPRHFWSLTEQEIEQAIRYERDLSIAVIELDNFKQINTRRGRAAADQVREAVAQIIRDTIRSGDAACSCADGEFAILFPETGVERAAEVAERIRADVAKFPIPTERGDMVITLCAGVAQLPEQGAATLDAFRVRAHTALHTAQREGPNRVIS